MKQLGIFINEFRFIHNNLFFSGYPVANIDFKVRMKEGGLPCCRLLKEYHKILQLLEKFFHQFNLNENLNNVENDVNHLLKVIEQHSNFVLGTCFDLLQEVSAENIEAFVKESEIKFN